MSVRQEYIYGQVVHLSMTFEIEATSTLTDPTTLTVKVRPPSHTVSTYVYGTDAEIVRDSAGTFHIDIPTAVTLGEGPWQVRVESTGTAAGADEVTFGVKETAFYE